MQKLQVALFGPTRTRNGTGPFVARALERTDRAQVVAVLGREPERTTRAAHELSHLFGRTVRAFVCDEALYTSVALDAVAICTPHEHHAAYAIGAARRGLHVFCEKPLAWPSIPSEKAGRDGALREALELLRLANANGTVMHLNTQWAYALDAFFRLHGPIARGAVRSLEIAFSPSSGEPEEMLAECLPHIAAMLLELGANREVANTNLSHEQSGSTSRLSLTMRVKGEAFQDIFVSVMLTQCERQPRPAAFAINDKWVTREVRMPAYDISFAGNGRVLKITDPLTLSVDDFIRKVRLARQGVHPSYEAVRGNVEFCLAVLDSERCGVC